MRNRGGFTRTGTCSHDDCTSRSHGYGALLLIEGVEDRVRHVGIVPRPTDYVPVGRPVWGGLTGFAIPALADERQTLDTRRVSIADFTPTADDPITMFTTSWCGFCVRLKAQLAREGVQLREVDIEADEEAAHFVENHNGGNRTVPTLLFFDGSTLTNPSLAAVRSHLAEIAAAP